MRCPYCAKNIRATNTHTCPHCGYTWSTCRTCGANGQPQLQLLTEPHQCTADGGIQTDLFIKGEAA
jgi:hypothetical protein